MKEDEKEIDDEKINDIAKNIWREVGEDMEEEGVEYINEEDVKLRLCKKVEDGLDEEQIMVMSILLKTADKFLNHKEEKRDIDSNMMFL